MNTENIKKEIEQKLEEVKSLNDLNEQELMYIYKTITNIKQLR